MKILIVDDDERIRRLIKSVLSDLEYDFVECGDGNLADTRYNEHRPDWVLMDLVMPDVDGITAIQRIRDSDAQARVIVVTSYEGEAMREAARKAGARAYVLKENLLDLREILGQT